MTARRSPCSCTSYDNDDEAEDNAERAEALFDDGTSLVTGEPFSEFFDDADVTVDGSTVVVTAELVGDHARGRLDHGVHPRPLVAAPLTTAPRRPLTVRTSS